MFGNISRDGEPSEPWLPYTRDPVVSCSQVHGSQDTMRLFVFEPEGVPRYTSALCHAWLGEGPVTGGGMRAR